MYLHDGWQKAIIFRKQVGAYTSHFVECMDNWWKIWPSQITTWPHPVRRSYRTHVFFSIPDMHATFTACIWDGLLESHTTSR